MLLAVLLLLAWVLVTYAENLRPQAEASALVFIKEVFGIGNTTHEIGLSYRFDRAVGLL